MTKLEAINFINSLSDDFDIDVSVSECYVPSGDIERLGVSRPKLKYWADNGYVRTIQRGKQKRYSLEDVMKYVKEKR